MNELIIFTHIPKTAGTSFIKTVVEPNLSSSQIYNYIGLKKFILDNQSKYSFVAGHSPYGLHRFTKKKVKYITFLRDPIERAVSFYYFIKSSDINLYKHPLRDYADSVSLGEFYKKRNFHNQQTRAIAGFFSDMIYPNIFLPSLERVMLKTAIENLRNCYFGFGILERFQESVALLVNKLGWKEIVEVAAQKKTLQRPKITDLDSETFQILSKAHQLDSHLYSFASKSFNAQ